MITNNQIDPTLLENQSSSGKGASQQTQTQPGIQTEQHNLPFVDDNLVMSWRQNWCVASRPEFLSNPY